LIENKGQILSSPKRLQLIGLRLF